MEEYKQQLINGDRFSRKQNKEWQAASRQIRLFKNEAAPIWETLDEAEKKRRASILRRLKEKQRTIPFRKFRDESYKNLQYIRYADDFIVGVIGSKEDAENIKSDLTVFLKEKLSLTLSAEKTKIKYSAEKARFLGSDVAIPKSQEVIIRKNGVKARGYSGAVKLYVPHEKWESKLRKYGAIRIKKDKATSKEYRKAIHRPKLLNMKDIEILSKYNSEVRELYNYYSKACNACAIGKFSALMHYSMLKTFANKYRTTANKIKARYFKNGRFAAEYPTKRGMKETVYFKGPFFRLDSKRTDQADILPAYKRHDKPNRLAAKLCAKTCELCGYYTTDIQTHQVKQLKSLTGQTQWETLMRKNRRKTLAVCPACHSLIHAND